MADVPRSLIAEIETLEKLFTVDTQKLKEITDHFVNELQRGLDAYDSHIPMNVAWVTGFPTGEEQGTFLALDMGGTNLRVCEITLPEEVGEFDIIQSKYRMPEELKTGSAEELWEYVADCVQQFIEYHHEDDELKEMGQIPWVSPSPTQLLKTTSTMESSSDGPKASTSQAWKDKTSFLNLKKPSRNE